MTRVRAIPGCVDAVPDAGLGRDRAVGRDAVPAAEKSRIALCAFGAPAGPIGEKPERIKKKYGLFSYA